MTHLSEWKRILEALLDGHTMVSPLFLTSTLCIQQYGRAIRNLRDRFGFKNVKNVYVGRSLTNKKITKFILLRNEKTERVLNELKAAGEVDKHLHFPPHYPLTPTTEKSHAPETPAHDFPSKAHKIAHENRLKKQEKKDQLTLI